MLGVLNIILRVIISLVGLGGPALTFILYASGENWQIDLMEILVPISIGYIVSVIIAMTVHFLVKNLWICILLSTGVCLFVYLLLSIFFVFDLSNPEEQMWLLVGLFFMCVNCLPMALSASGSTILQIRFNIFSKELYKWIASLRF